MAPLSFLDLDYNVAENRITTLIQCGPPQLRITSKVPTPVDACGEDSEYTASSKVDLVITNPAGYDQYRIARDPTELTAKNPDGTPVIPWTNLETGNNCIHASSSTYARIPNVDLFATDELNITDNEKGPKNVFAQLRDIDAGAIESRVMQDSIVFNYPWMTTYRGDVHSNESIAGEASDPLSDYSFWECNPPSGYNNNSDYMVSTHNGSVQTLSGGPRAPSGCGGAKKTFKSVAGWYMNETSGSAYENLRDEINYDQLWNQRTYECSNSGWYVNIQGETIDTSCTVVKEPTGRGHVIYATGSNGTIGRGSDMVIGNKSDSSQSGAITIVTERDVTIKNNSSYQVSAGNVQSSRQLGSLAVLAKDANITIEEDLSLIVGLYFAEGEASANTGIIFTGTEPNSNTMSPNKLSIYGSLIARQIEFNRNWMGNFF
ncbi:hypothetical protein ACFL2D_00355 [Patescibacteria group bacterium]